MTDLIPYIIGAVVALIGAGALRLLPFSFGRKRQEPASPPAPPEPTEPKKTAEEYRNDDIDDQIDAVVKAAREHSVDPAVVSDGLDWLDADDL